LQTPNSPI